jgi:hypothetical protein
MDNKKETVDFSTKIIILATCDPKVVVSQKSEEDMCIGGNKVVMENGKRRFLQSDGKSAFHSQLKYGKC